MADATSFAQKKEALRFEVLARLKAMDDVTRRGAARSACQRLIELPEVQDAGSILFYMPTRLEIDPSAAMSACLEDGQRVAVPRVDEHSNEIEAIAIEALDAREFERDTMGIMVPRAGKLVRATEIDVVVVPGIAFDRRGWRLGRGAGFYDRLLVRLTDRCRSIGFAFGCQVVDAVPAEAHDRRVAALVTETEAVECGDETRGGSAGT